MTWTKHERIVDTTSTPWAKRAWWAPSIIEKGGRYFLFFGANAIQKNEQLGDIGVAVAERPDGPLEDHLAKPIVGRFHNGAQPIDQFVFK